MTEDEMVGWHHWLNGHEFEQVPEIGEGQEAWHTAVHGVTKSQTRLSDWTELNWIDNSQVINLLKVQDSNILGLLFFSCIPEIHSHESWWWCHTAWRSRKELALGENASSGQDGMTWTWFTLSPKATEFTFELYGNSIILTKDSEYVWLRLMVTRSIMNFGLYNFLWLIEHDTIMEGGFPDGSVVKNLPARQEMWVLSLGQEDSPGGRNGNPL